MRLEGILQDPDGNEFDAAIDSDPYNFSLQLTPIEPHLATRFGVDCDPQQIDAHVALFPDLRYMRTFGTGTAGDTRLDPVSGKRLQTLARMGAVAHCSWQHWSEQELLIWLDTLPSVYATAAPGFEVWLTYHHEPMKKIEPTEYQRRVARMVAMIAEHPSGNLVKQHGPIVTRYWTDVAEGDTALWAYEGMTFFGSDCYNGPQTVKYLSPPEMFDGVCNQAFLYGVPWIVPEFGGQRLSADTNGVGRTAWLHDCATYIEESPTCLGVGWWCLNQTHLDNSQPELAAWQEILTGNK